MTKRTIYILLIATALAACLLVVISVMQWMREDPFSELADEVESATEIRYQSTFGGDYTVLTDRSKIQQVAKTFRAAKKLGGFRSYPGPNCKMVVLLDDGRTEVVWISITYVSTKSGVEPVDIVTVSWHDQIRVISNPFEGAKGESEKE